MGSPDGVPCSGSTDHQACGAQHPVAVRSLDRNVDLVRQAEIVRRDDEVLAGGADGLLLREMRSGRFLAVAQEAEELDPFAQAAFHHLGRAHHLADDRGDLRRPEIEATVEVLDRGEDLGVG